MNNDSQTIAMHFSKDALFNKLGCNATFFNELIELAIKDLVLLKSSLIEYNNTQKEAKVRTVAHKLKGIAGSIGLPTLKDNITTLEDVVFSNTEAFHKTISTICEEVDFLVEKCLLKI